MKFIFSFLLMSSVCAREIITIHHPKELTEDAKFVSLTLQRQMALPESFIHLDSSPCQESEYNVATICILDNGEVEVKQIKVALMQKMLRAFGDINETP